MSDTIHLHSAHVIFHSRRSRLRTQKSLKLLAAGALPQTPLGELTALPCPLADGERARCPLPKTYPHSQPFELSPFGPLSWGPLTFCWTRAPQSLAMPLGCPFVLGIMTTGNGRGSWSPIRRNGKFCVTVGLLLALLTTWHADLAGHSAEVSHMLA